MLTCHGLHDGWHAMPWGGSLCMQKGACGFRKADLDGEAQGAASSGIAVNNHFES